MGTIFEPSLSTSTLRPPLVSASAPSMADTLPSINFGFDELRERMAKFTHRFDDFIAEGRKRVLEERNQFRMNVAELQEDQSLKTRALAILSSQSQSHASMLAKEAAETAEMHAAISSLTQQRDSRASHRDRIRTSIAATRKQISQRLEAQAQYSAQIEAQARFNAPELDFWVEHLCLRIEGAGVVDRLRFVFSHLDEREWEREGWFELSTERRDYEVVEVRPKVEKEGVEKCVERLNESRDLGEFLKGMRELFVKAMR